MEAGKQQYSGRRIRTSAPQVGLLETSRRTRVGAEPPKNIPLIPWQPAHPLFFFYIVSNNAPNCSVSQAVYRQGVIGVVAIFERLAIGTFLYLFVAS